ncbi:MAG TPA: hypothetical protein VHL08_08180 [Dongiaceae bacterium]|nr:hypothetical protein [Dongiaceae bacterium]
MTVLIMGLAISFQRGFDMLDEASYIYDMTHPSLQGANLAHVIAGTAGAVFQNNIILWRLIGLALLTGAALLFGRGLYNLCHILGIHLRSTHNDISLSLISLAGALLYYATVPATPSYNLYGSAGLLGGFGGLMMALDARQGRKRHLWLLLASFFLFMMIVGRPPSLAMYCLAALPLLFACATRMNWRFLAGTAFWHAGYGLLWGIFIIWSLGLTTEISLWIKWLTLEAHTTHKLGPTLRQHGVDLLFVMSRIAWLSLAAIAAAYIAAVAALILKKGHVSRGREEFFENLASALALEVVLLPLWIPFSYLFRWPSTSFLSQACEEIVCLRAPGLDGVLFTDMLGVQAICCALVIFLDRRRSYPRKKASSSPGYPLVFILCFLGLAIPTSSFLTNTGLFAHSIVNLAPLFTASYLMVAAMPVKDRLRRMASLPLLCAGLLLCVAVGVMHGRLLFPYGLARDMSRQTAMLEAPPSLHGLRVDPDVKKILTDVGDILAQHGFDPRRDVILAPYNIPGVVAGLGARALGSAWLETWPPSTVTAFRACTFLADDRIDLAARGRVFMIQNMPLLPPLHDCAAARGLDIEHSQVLSTIRLDPNRNLTISLIATH